MAKKGNISIFVPHNGCPQQCSFCNQKTITGKSEQPTPSNVENAVKKALAKKGYKYEIAFFGGSFTAIDRDYMVSLLKAAFAFLDNERIYGIRISTRPDFIDNEVLDILKKYGVKLKLNVEKATVKAEPSLLKTLLYNLIDNACKASESGKPVTLTGYVDSDRYRFCVTDSGCGIAEDDLAKITEPFYMVDKSRSRSMGGAGLGLSICNEIAKLHGSTLEIVSEVGKGTDISFTVSLADNSEESEDFEDEI